MTKPLALPGSPVPYAIDPIRGNPLSLRFTYYPSGQPNVGRPAYGRVKRGSTWIEATQSVRREIAPRLCGVTALHEMVQQFLEHAVETNVSNGTVSKYASHWNKWITPEEMRTADTQQIGIRQWQQLTDHLNREMASVKTIDAVLSTFNKFVDFGVTRGHIPRNFLTWEDANTRDSLIRACRSKAKTYCGVGLESVTLSMCPTHEEVLDFADALEEAWPGYGRLFVLLAEATGCRFAELLALRVRDIRLLDEGIFVNIESQLDKNRPWPATKPPKNGRTRQTRAWKSARDVLETLIAQAEARGDDGWLFPPPPTVKKNLYDWVARRSGEAARSTQFPRFHWLRHRYASVSVNPRSKGGRGWSFRRVQKALGHRKLHTTTDFYVLDLE